jgi:hypothetical protein
MILLYEERNDTYTVYASAWIVAKYKPDGQHQTLASRNAIHCELGLEIVYQDGDTMYADDSEYHNP